MKHFILDLTYIAPLSQVDAYLEEHRAFVAKGYDNQLFLASGAKEPRTGGIIIARAESLEALHSLIREDPFYVHHLVDYQITEFHARRFHPEFSTWFI